MSLRASVWAWNQQVPPTAKLVLLVLADHAHDNGEAAYPSVATMSRKTGISTRQVQRVLSELVNQKVIRVQREGGRGSLRYAATWYALNIEKDFAIPRGQFVASGCTPELRATVIVRDGFTCQLCDREGDEVMGPDGVPWEIDRIESGGHYTPENVRLTCRTCNRKRGQGRHGDVPGRGDMSVLSGATLMSPEPSLEPTTTPHTPHGGADDALIPVASVDGACQTGNMSTPTATRSRREVGDTDPQWVEFWSVYPKRVGKGAARKAWTKAIGKAPVEDLLDATRRFANQVDQRVRTQRVVAGEDPRAFIPHPATWLNQERWSDEYQRGEVAGRGVQPPKKDQECQTHPGNWADRCRGCAADAKAKD